MSEYGGHDKAGPSVGIVAKKFFSFASPPGEMKLQSGAALGPITLAYETYGTLNEAGTNAVLVLHALSGSSHAAGVYTEEDEKPGWWNNMIGPGKAIDTSRYFVLCANIIGSCYGSTGPSSIDPHTGKAYGMRFPMFTMGDIVETQKRLADHLGIPRFLSMIGGSIGGMQGLEWAVRFPEMVASVIPIASTCSRSALAIGLSEAQRQAIVSDPAWNGGDYYGGPGPVRGLALARMIGHISYLSPKAMEDKFDADRLRPRDVAVEFEKRFSVGSYLGYQGSRFVERFDANSYVTLTLAMDLFDLGATQQELARAFSKATCRFLIISFSSDWLFPPEQSRELVTACIQSKAPVSYAEIKSDCGHDAFLLDKEVALYGGMTRAFLRNVASGDSGPVEAKDSHGPTSIFSQHRVDYDRIVELIPEGASVLDLGCGSGGLLARIRSKNPARLAGVELDPAQLLTCISRNFNVVQADLNKPLAFGEGEFDCVVLSQTLQAVNEIQTLISEMLRIGKTGIVSIPNFAYRPLREMLANQGRAPKSHGVLRYEWYNTPNVRFFTIADFEDYCKDHQITIRTRIYLNTESGTEVHQQNDPNLNADLAIFVVAGGRK